MMLPTRPLQHGLYVHGGDSDRISNTVVRELATAAEPVDRRRAHSEEFRDLSHGEEVANRAKGFVIRREAVQQGSTKILAQACMGLHILAFLVGRTSRICTGLHVLARI
jgi:hypothetical protein